jgi:hypothetical protein
MPLRFVPKSFAQLRFGRILGFSSRHLSQAAAPSLSNATCSSFAMRVVQHNCQRHQTKSKCLRSTAISEPPAASQMRTVLSSDAVTTREPSALKAAEKNVSCPRSTVDPCRRHTLCDFVTEAGQSLQNGTPARGGRHRAKIIRNKALRHYLREQRPIGQASPIMYRLGSSKKLPSTSRDRTAGARLGAFRLETAQDGGAP